VYYTLEPDVAGWLGEMTEMDTTTWPETVHRLEYEMAGWRGDCLLAAHPVHILEAAAARELASRKFGGFERRDVTVSLSDQFLQLQPDVHLPEFIWLHVTGVAGVDDLGAQRNGGLVVSGDVLAVLHKHGMANCELVEFAAATGCCRAAVNSPGISPQPRPTSRRPATFTSR